MLSRVARKYEACVALPDEPNQFEHLASTNLTGLVHDDDSPFSQFAFEKKTRDRRGRWESRLLHAHDLLTLRSKNNNAAARLLNLTDQFTQDKTFPSTRPSTKDRYSVR